MYMEVVVKYYKNCTGFHNMHGHVVHTQHVQDQ